MPPQSPHQKYRKAPQEETDMDHLITTALDGDNEGLMWDEDAFIQQQGSRSSVGRFLWSVARFVLGSEWFFLFLIGLLSACIVYSMEVGINSFLGARMKLYHMLPAAAAYFSYVAIMVSAILLAAKLTSFWPSAAGSGIPELKVMFRSHTETGTHLSFFTIVVKVFGLILANGGGLPVGKEGPSVHIASAVANQLATHLPIFRSFASDTNNLRMELIASGCAVGIAAPFGSPVGGLLFSIEKTSSGYFPTRNYPRGFFAAVVGALTYALIDAYVTDGSISAVISTDFPEEPYAPVELIIFAGVGILCALLSPIFVSYYTWV